MSLTQNIYSKKYCNAFIITFIVFDKIIFDKIKFKRESLA